MDEKLKNDLKYLTDVYKSLHPIFAEIMLLYAKDIAKVSTNYGEATIKHIEECIEKRYLPGWHHAGSTGGINADISIVFFASERRITKELFENGIECLYDLAKLTYSELKAMGFDENDLDKIYKRVDEFGVDVRPMKSKRRLRFEKNCIEFMEYIKIAEQCFIRSKCHSNGRHMDVKRCEKIIRRAKYDYMNNENIYEKWYGKPNQDLEAFLLNQKPRTPLLERIKREPLEKE